MAGEILIADRNQTSIAVMVSDNEDYLNRAFHFNVLGECKSVIFRDAVTGKIIIFDDWKIDPANPESAIVWNSGTDYPAVFAEMQVAATGIMAPITLTPSTVSITR